MDQEGYIEINGVGVFPVDPLGFHLISAVNWQAMHDADEHLEELEERVGRQQFS